MNKPSLIYCAILGTCIGIAVTFFLNKLDNKPKIAASAESKINQNGNMTSRLNRNRNTEKNDELIKEVKSLKQEINTIKTALNQLSSRIASVNEQQSINDELTDILKSDQDLAKQKAAEELLKLQGDERFEEQIIAIKNNYDSESIDADWSEEKIIEVQAALNSLSDEIHDGVEVKEMDCRSSMCRLKVEYHDEIAMLDFEMQLPMLVGENFPRLSVQHDQMENLIEVTYFLHSKEI